MQGQSSTARKAARSGLGTDATRSPIDRRLRSGVRADALPCAQPRAVH